MFPIVSSSLGRSFDFHSRKSSMGGLPDKNITRLYRALDKRRNKKGKKPLLTSQYRIVGDLLRIWTATSPRVPKVSSSTRISAEQCRQNLSEPQMRDDLGTALDLYLENMGLSYAAEVVTDTHVNIGDPYLYLSAGLHPWLIEGLLQHPLLELPTLTSTVHKKETAVAMLKHIAQYEATRLTKPTRYNLYMSAAEYEKALEMLTKISEEYPSHTIAIQNAQTYPLAGLIEELSNLDVAGLSPKEGYKRLHAIIAEYREKLKTQALQYLSGEIRPGKPENNLIISQLQYMEIDSLFEAFVEAPESSEFQGALDRLIQKYTQIKYPLRPSVPIPPLLTHVLMVQPSDGIRDKVSGLRVYQALEGKFSTGSLNFWMDNVELGHARLYAASKQLIHTGSATLSGRVEAGLRRLFGRQEIDYQITEDDFRYLYERTREDKKNQGNLVYLTSQSVPESEVPSFSEQLIQVARQVLIDRTSKSLDIDTILTLKVSPSARTDKNGTIQCNLRLQLVPPQFWGEIIQANYYDLHSLNQNIEEMHAILKEFPNISNIWKGQIGEMHVWRQVLLAKETDLVTGEIRTLEPLMREENMILSVNSSDARIWGIDHAVFTVLGRKLRVVFIETKARKDKEDLNDPLRTIRRSKQLTLEHVLSNEQLWMAVERLADVRDIQEGNIEFKRLLATVNIDPQSSNLGEVQFYEVSGAEANEIQSTTLKDILLED